MGYTVYVHLTLSIVNPSTKNVETGFLGLKDVLHSVPIYHFTRGDKW